MRTTEIASACVLLLACSGQTTAPATAGSSAGGAGATGASSGATTGAGTGTGGSGTTGTTTTGNAGTAGTETGNDALNGTFGSSGAPVTGSTGTAGNVSGMSGAVPIACDAGPPPPVCPAGLIGSSVIDDEYGQCFAVTYCLPLGGCQQGASCTPGSGRCGYGAAGCGTTCVCDATGLYSNCTNDCGGVSKAAPDAGSYDASLAVDASMAGDSSMPDDADSDADANEAADR